MRTACLHFFRGLIRSSKLDSLPHKKCPKRGIDVFWRRVRDSNPRTCYSQQFSRLPQSTTLPTLRAKDNTRLPFKKNGFSFLSQNFYITSVNLALICIRQIELEYPHIAVLQHINFTSVLISMPFLLGILT